jgi:hypothetical protein
MTEATRLELRTADGRGAFDRWVTWSTRWELKLPPGEYQATLSTLAGGSRQATWTAADGARYELP